MAEEYTITPLGAVGGSIKFPFGQMLATPKQNPVNITNSFGHGPVGFKPFESPQIPPTPEAVTQPQNSPVTMPGSLNENPVAQAMRSSVQHPNRPKIYMPDFTRGRHQRGHNWLDAFSVANMR